MTAEAKVLLWIHGSASPVLDRLFWVSHWLGTGRFCFALVMLAVLIAIWRGRRREAWLWVALGLSTYFGQLGLKHLVMRARPELWATAISPDSSSFPSGHAWAAATFYPLIARAIARAHPRGRIPAYVAALGVAFFVGFGRLYLGVHWPTDVLAGWALGAAQTWIGIRVADRRAGDAAPR